jgi:hypothetical protein
LGNSAELAPQNDAAEPEVAEEDDFISIPEALIFFYIFLFISISYFYLIDVVSMLG